jgi:hypothetical protein
MSYFVYELVNLMGTVEYVGRTKEPKMRWIEHVKKKPIEGISGKGLFYGRQDLVMNLVKEFDNVKDANYYEGRLKLEHGFNWGERDNFVKNGFRAPRAVLVYKLDGTFVGDFVSTEEAAHRLDVWSGNIGKVLSGKIKQTGGYTFKYKTI